MKKLYLILIAIQIAISGYSQNPEFRLPGLLSDHAVLQRDSKVRLWGWCPSVWDLKIVCSWAPKDTVCVKSDMYCAWECFVKTPKEKGPYTIQFIGWENKLEREISDILIGETWLCSGQSNMEYNMSYRISDANDVSEEVKNDQIRFFKVKKATSRYPVEYIDGYWEVCSPDTYQDFSAVAFFFGQHLYKSLNIPVGMIGSYWGGTAIEPWINENGYQSDLHLLELSQKQQIPGWSPTANSSIYNAMINPVKNYTVAGVLWYQGEANNERPCDYGDLLTGMVKGWRNEFRSEFPFYFVQIAPWDGYAHRNAAYLREQQSLVAENLDKTEMIVITDLVNDISDIHPNMKKNVGERLANVALCKTYNKNEINPFSPTVKSVEVDGNKLIIHTNAVGKLKSKTFPIKHFEILDKEGHIYPATAKILENGCISVSAKGVKSPVDVRYCFTNDAMPSIFDSNGLPLAPFRTDKK